ncbi:serine protease [Grimontia sp. AD028]|uniref:Serine protease n=1 Tax=Grimontia celer TaxID=1796497 RepID=A0A128F8F6_9GAMM|nr:MULTISPECIES: hypothetical protein [Grimontia]KKD61233.1 serine protease [Grimontia sp. AD028]CZF83103.1 hypothetical protein GCE9029_03638 [Grimontia celer]
MKKLTLISLMALLMAGCAENAADTDTMVGADRDSHGCIPSAGYQWCAHTNRCERPWELAEVEGFDNTPELFEAFCAE